MSLSRGQTAHLDVLPPHHHSPGDAVSDIWHHYTVYSPVVTAPRDMYISEMHFEFFNAPTSTVHHTSFADISKDNTTCPNMTSWRELFSYASDRMSNNDIKFPDGYALKIDKGTPLQLYLMVHNPEPPLGEGDTYHDVYTKMILKESPQDPKHLKLVIPHLLHLDDQACKWAQADRSDSLIFTVPPLKRNYTYSAEGKSDLSASMTFKKPATIMNVTGHLHPWQGGKDVVLHKNDDVAHVFRSTLSSIPYLYFTPYSTSTFRVNAGDTLWISSTYDNPYATPIRGAMGMAGFYYSED